jgi:hypothetical protein
MLSSLPGSRRQLSNCCGDAFCYGRNDRHRSSDEGDAPLLGDGDVAPGEGEVVMGGEESDQTESKAADGLGEAEPVEAKPRERLIR